MNPPLAVEHSTDQVELKARNFSLEGLKDIPRSIIPVPYYTFVQPSSKKVTLADGSRAENGTFLMNDIRQTAQVLYMVILRAKRQVRQQYNEDTKQNEDVVSLQVLGLNLERGGKPFIVGLPVTSFSTLGKTFEELETRQAIHAWDYVIYLSGEEVKRDKKTAEGIKTVDYWVADVEVGEPLKDDQKQIAAECYQDFAAKLDRDDDEDDLEALAGKDKK